MNATPLDGLIVVDLTRYLPGPFCTRLLADLGAQIIKIESPAGDPMRGIAWYDLLNAGKRIVTLDLRDPASRDELHAQLSIADVCVEGFKPETAKAIGVDGATLAARYPSLVHCSITGYGPSGPHANRAAHDINYQADAGLVPAWAPRPAPGLLIADITAALQATIAIVAALVGRRGASLQVSLLDAARLWAPFLPPPVLSGEYACYHLYEASDGRLVALGALEQKFWARFCDRVGRPDWIELHLAAEAQRDLIREVGALFRTRSVAEWEAELAPTDCCFSIVSG